MNPQEQIHPSIQPILRGAITQGFRAFVVTPGGPADKRPVEFAYLCLDIEGSFAIVSAPGNKLELPELSAPIQPHRDYGSGVLTDYDGSVADALTQLRVICSQETVVVRFMPKTMPVVPNRGKRALEGWHNGVTEITADMFTSEG